MQTNQVSDKTLLKTINQKIARAGSGGQTRIAATIQNGTVTLTGVLGYETQRSPLTKAVSAVAGVKRVVDQLKVPPKQKRV